MSRPATALKIIPKVFIARVNTSDDKRHSAHTAAVAGHTKGGKGRISEKVTAIPLEKRNGCQGKASDAGRGHPVLRTSGQRQDKGNGRCQRLPFILGVGGRRGGCERGGRLGRLGATHWTRAGLRALELATVAGNTRAK